MTTKNREKQAYIAYCHSASSKASCDIEGLPFSRSSLMCASKASFALIIECTCLFECMSSSVGDIGKNAMRRVPSDEVCTTTTPGGWYGAPTGDSCTTPIRPAAFLLRTGGRFVKDRQS